MERYNSLGRSRHCDETVIIMITVFIVILITSQDKTQANHPLVEGSFLADTSVFVTSKTL